MTILIWQKSDNDTQVTKIKSALYVTDGQFFTTDVCTNFKVTWHKNYAKYKKSGLIKYRHCAIVKKIRGKLPAPIVRGKGDTFWKWLYFQLWRARDLDLWSVHTAYHSESLDDLYLHAKFHWNRRNLLWTDGSTYVHTVRTHAHTYEWTDIWN